MKGVELLGELMDHFRSKFGVHAERGGYSFVVGCDGAAHFMREIFTSLKKIEGVVVDDTPDTLFLYRSVPVRLRFQSTPGACYLLQNSDIPGRTCCDQASTASVIVALTRATA